MMNIGIVTEADRNEATKLQRRQQFEDERKKRIFNSKQRTVGMDYDAIKKQIEERTKQRHINAELERRFEEQMERQQHAVFAMSKEAERRARQLASDINNFRCKFQRPEMCREYDLNDPLWMRKTKPTRRSDDDDINLGLSSAQIFNGEDLGFKERQHRQREQQRAWLDQQIIERKQAQESRQMAEHLMEDSLFSRDNKLSDMVQSQTNIRKQVDQECCKYNIEMAKMKSLQKQQKKQETNEDDLAEIYNMLTSDMLTENPDVAQSKLDPNKKIAFMYRGMTPDELSALRQEQYKQVLSNRRRTTDQQMMDKQWEQYASNVDRELKLKEIELERKNKELLIANVRYNQNLAKMQKAYKEHSNKNLQNNIITEEFYEQFNKTSR